MDYPDVCEAGDFSLIYETLRIWEWHLVAAALMGCYGHPAFVKLCSEHIFGLLYCHSECPITV